ncbi:hypothetical protein B0H66DRAFT_526903 [Apodospora peruviana]|uniref:Uncharacterized protein n=1 Tax=Apodospora peruviana TaxID=516989 RepID=A0AAE0IQJ5_9PEZI|nr:hypothetical protein B0H66DRAFT_526903 [Apodospora peruviana]
MDSRNPALPKVPLPVPEPRPPIEDPPLPEPPPPSRDFPLPELRLSIRDSVEEDAGRNLKPNFADEFKSGKLFEHNADEFETVNLGPQVEKQDRPPPKGHKYRGRKYFSSLAWWKSEYWYAIVCVAAALCLSMLLRAYNNQVVPELDWGIQIDTAIIAIVTIMRISLRAFVDAAFSQAAWIWVSEMCQRKCKHTAYLSDFKDEIQVSQHTIIIVSAPYSHKSTRRHRVGCMGAAIIILTQGFETFSQQMVTFEQRPQKIRVENRTSMAAPPPARSEVWDTYLSRGYTGDFVPTLSTKAAVYSGIISTQSPLAMVSCETGNCSWPLVPTLAACGECTSIPVSTSCNQTSRICTYSTESGTSIADPMDEAEHTTFTVSPSNGTVYQINSTNRAYLSVFDMLSLSLASGQDLVTDANQCALWFCIRSYRVSVSEGIQKHTVEGNWSETTLEHGNGLRGTQYVFSNISDNLNVDNKTRYAVTHEAMTALRGFMTDVTYGTVRANAYTLDYSSDWVEAMWNATDHLQDWIGVLAESLTVEIRSNGRTDGGLPTNRYDGSATQLALFIRVHWGWMIYPGGMILISIYYLFHAIFSSARFGVPVWRGGALPMLFSRVDDNINDRVGDGMDVPNGLEDRVGHIPVAMYRGENGQWGFRTTAGERDGS